MQDCQFVSAMGPPGGGRTSVTSRYTRHFATCAVTEPSTSSLLHIFTTIQAWFLASRGFPQPVMDLRDRVVEATMQVYSTVMAQLLPTPTKSHYVFNLRDFSRVIQGLQMQSPKALAANMQAAAGSGGMPVGAAQQHVKLWVHEVLRVFYDRCGVGMDSRGMDSPDYISALPPITSYQP